VDPFRSIRPHLENSILGITRFTLHTVGYGYGFVTAGGRLELRPFVEVTLGRAENHGGGVLTPQILYGTTRVRAVSAGVRATWGFQGHRMGRYGNLLDPTPGSVHPM
ncbi:MAG TPA: hypothetical protein VNH46_02220, partial [Gemmatimonadales bacterium]|nr:hypothetical protein [Gemmatimonadales bacterium]